MNNLYAVSQRRGPSSTFQPSAPHHSRQLPAKLRRHSGLGRSSRGGGVGNRRRRSRKHGRDEDRNFKRVCLSSNVAEEALCWCGGRPPCGPVGISAKSACGKAQPEAISREPSTLAGFNRSLSLESHGIQSHWTDRVSFDSLLFYAAPDSLALFLVVHADRCAFCLGRGCNEFPAAGPTSHFALYRCDGN